jgi:hypothetical protein
LDAIGRQVERIQLVETCLAGKKVTKDIFSYVKTFDKSTEALTHAQLTLQKLRGGTPHGVLNKKDKAKE